MATCHDCTHLYCCKYDRFFGVDAVENKCNYFKSASDVVEVVRCKDCKHWNNRVFDPITEHHIGECHCSQWENDYFWYETCENDFCSYGVRKEDT